MSVILYIIYLVKSLSDQEDILIYLNTYPFLLRQYLSIFEYLPEIFGHRRLVPALNDTSVVNNNVQKKLNEEQCRIC
jgi:hypothetical protein